MSKILATLLTATMAQAAFAGADALTVIADALSRPGTMCTGATYKVSLPQSPDPVVYDLTLSSRMPGDTLCLCDYLIDWTLHRPAGDAKGFAAYYGGNFFRYRDGKLLENHMAQDPIPMTGPAAVQRNSQFTDLLMPFVADRLRDMATNPQYTYTVTDNNGTTRIKGVQRVNGYDALEYTLVFDSQSRPVSFDYLYNPSTIAEQLIEVTFAPVECGVIPADEQQLVDLYPEVFDRYRASTFRAENMAGTALPAFKAFTTTRERYVHERGATFANPTIVVFLDPEVATSSQVVADVRRATDGMAVNADVLFVFRGDDSDAVESIAGSPRVGEQTLTRADALFRDCGIAVSPTIMFVGRDGIVKDVMTGINQNMTSIVIQKTTLAAMP
jgi:hypothetical protein